MAQINVVKNNTKCIKTIDILQKTIYTNRVSKRQSGDCPLIWLSKRPPKFRDSWRSFCCLYLFFRFFIEKTISTVFKTIEITFNAIFIIAKSMRTTGA